MPRKGQRKKKTMGGKKTGPRAGRRAGVAHTAMPDVISSLTRAHNDLAAQRAVLDAQISAIEQALATMGGTFMARAQVRPVVAGATRGRRRSGSLKEYIGRVLSAKSGPMAVKDITAAVMKAGYPTRNKTLAKSVGIALTQMPEVRKVGRGPFRMK